MSTITTDSKRRPINWWRLTLLTHRYVGIAIGMFVLLWCLSGVVMMYVPYPALSSDEELLGLPALPACCANVAQPAATSGFVKSLRVEQYGDVPVARITGPSGVQQIVLLSNGGTPGTPDAATLDTLGAAFASARGWLAADTRQWVETDQWTVHGRFNTHRPMRKFSNASGQEWYLSSKTGELVQTTDRQERFWNWLGSVPHWLYPTILRQHTAVWAQVVIWATILSLFLAITGAVIGVRHFRWRRRVRHSPYRGWMLWHHYSGLVFGLFILTWLASGLVSMTPWGAFESRSFAGERQLLNGTTITVKDLFAELAKINTTADTVRLETAFWNGKPFFLAYTRTGAVRRLDANGVAPDLSLNDIQDAATSLKNETASIDLLDVGDHYYYSHHNDVEFPVYRLVYPDGERFYLSARSGRLLAAVDNSARWSRWLFEGFHRGDFAAWMRTRPVWDILMLTLLLGTTVGVGTGTYLGLRRTFS